MTFSPSDWAPAANELAGKTILITGAGGAFGAMIRMSGVGESVGAVAEEFDLSYVLLAWGVTAFIRIAQGLIDLRNVIPLRS